MKYFLRDKGWELLPAEFTYVLLHRGREVARRESDVLEDSVQWRGVTLTTDQIKVFYGEEKLVASLGFEAASVVQGDLRVDGIRAAVEVEWKSPFKVKASARVSS